MARPLAAKGKDATRQSSPAASASAGDRPAVTTSGSVKQTAGIAAGWKWRRRHQLGHHLALRHGAVRQHGFAGQVADGPASRIEVRH